MPTLLVYACMHAIVMCVGGGWGGGGRSVWVQPDILNKPSPIFSMILTSWKGSITFDSLAYSMSASSKLSWKSATLSCSHCSDDSGDIVKVKGHIAWVRGYIVRVGGDNVRGYCEVTL